MRKVGKVQQLIGCGRRKAEEPEKTLEISEEGGWKPRLAVGAEGVCLRCVAFEVLQTDTETVFGKQLKTDV